MLFIYAGVCSLLLLLRPVWNLCALLDGFSELHRMVFVVIQKGKGEASTSPKGAAMCVWASQRVWVYLWMGGTTVLLAVEWASTSAVPLLCVTFELVLVPGEEQGKPTQ